MRTETISIAIALTLLAVASIFRVPTMQAYMAADAYQDRYYLPMAEALPWFALGPGKRSRTSSG